MGKSTLIGRMLHDAGLVYRDQVAAIQKASALDGGIDFSLLTDGLGAEREQKITIDVAYRYFSKGANKYILADVPGHEQYTRNMITGASQSDMAIIVIDAERGLDIQSRRHLHILSLLHIFPIIIVINKMDIVDFNEDVFYAIKNEVHELFDEKDRAYIRYIPSCALSGDMLVRNRNENLSRLSDTTLFDLIESIDARRDPHGRLPSVMHIQTVVKHNGVRWYLGTVSGMVSVGDVVSLPSREVETKIDDIIHGYEHMLSVENTYAAVSFGDYIDAGRGDIVVAGDDHELRTTRHIEALLFWMDRSACEAGRNYILRTGTKITRCSIETVLSRREMDNFTDVQCTELALNDIGRVIIKTLDEIVVTDYDIHHHIGSFILMDDRSNQTVAGGMIL